ncbi:roadblock/LC7 domain-containing protein [Streptomyces hoynatensis]|uniref:Roadblock/LC7 domain-containing protein n=2 Tax=Streptomyces hoynatensis TaxID=1141874 RepID=A0A3A9ZCF2_9ACTN|nr:roadblock/LC7 domain-containing protein [Streptomyces hoynatensis]
MDWMLRDLAATVPGIRHIVVLSADGLCMAQYGAERDCGDRLAAAASGIKSLAQSIARELPGEPPRDLAGELPRELRKSPPGEDPGVRMVLLELNGGHFYLMAAGDRSYLAVTAASEIDPGLISQRMRDLVLRIGEHLSSAPRTPEQAAP